MIGVPDEKSGEAVKLFVVPRDPELTIEEIKAFCREQFTASTQRPEERSAATPAKTRP